MAAIPTPEVEITVPEEGQSEALRGLHNVAFEDHWGSAHITREAWEEHWNSVSSRRSMSSVALMAPVAQAPHGVHAGEHD